MGVDLNVKVFTATIVMTYDSNLADLNPVFIFEDRKKLQEFIDLCLDHKYTVQINVDEDSLDEENKVRSDVKKENV